MVSSNYYPALSNLINIDNLPDPIQEFVEPFLDDVFYKDFLFEIINQEPQNIIN